MEPGDFFEGIPYSGPSRQKCFEGKEKFEMPSKFRLLVVDDEAALREIFRHEFELAGYDVDEAEDGHVAIDAFRKTRTI